jgi:hypothetical protein
MAQATAKFNWCEWAKPAGDAFATLWDAVDEAQMAIYRSLQAQNPGSRDLEYFSAEFSSASDGLLAVVLDTVMPEPDESREPFSEGDGRSAVDNELTWRADASRVNGT